MCLIIFGFDVHPTYSFVLAANRDEFYARPTAPAAFWKDAPEVLAGRDTAAGGTWLGVTKRGRFAAVTNYRDLSVTAGAKSRGHLTKDFLIGNESPENYLQKIEREKQAYSGFNLLVGDFAGQKNELFYLSNRTDEIKKLSTGIYGLSNALLDSNWHKVAASKAKFTAAVQESAALAPAALFQILADRYISPDEKLPDTGIGIERERVLSPVFIETAGYGTRSSTILTVERGGQVNFYEKTFIGEAGNINFQFALDNQNQLVGFPDRKI